MNPAIDAFLSADISWKTKNGANIVSDNHAVPVNPNSIDSIAVSINSHANMFFRFLTSYFSGLVCISESPNDRQTPISATASIDDSGFKVFDQGITASVDSSFSGSVDISESLNVSGTISGYGIGITNFDIAKLALIADFQ